MTSLPSTAVKPEDLSWPIITIDFEASGKVPELPAPSLSAARSVSRISRASSGMIHLWPTMSRRGEKDFTFYKLQQFILKNSAKANEARLDREIQSLDAIIEGKARSPGVGDAT